MRNRQEVLQLLDREKIPYRLAEHPAVFTIEEMQQLHLEGEQQIAKNLFLRDDKKRAWYLLVLPAFLLGVVPALFELLRCLKYARLQREPG